MSLFDLSFAVAALSTHDVTITRYTAGGYDANGRAVARTSTSSTARGSVQPMTGQDLKRLPEGTSITDTIAVFVTAELAAGDEFTIDGERYQVAFVAPWMTAGNYTRAVGIALDAREV